MIDFARAAAASGAILLLLLLSCTTGIAQKTTRHFVFVSREREALRNPAFYLNPGVQGAQIKYLWRRLEPQKDSYDFGEIEEDLAFLSSKGKRLFIQIQDVTFDSTVNAVPAYLLDDSTYHGGQASQYGIREDGTPVKSGWVARRWDDAVARRFEKLLGRLGERFDGRIEGINLPETAVDFPEMPGLVPKGFTARAYVAAMKRYMKSLRECFKESVPILYANFMPSDGEEELRELYDYAREIKIGMGGPDIKVYRRFQMKNSYPLIRSVSGIVTTGMAVQDGNFETINPKTGKQVTLADILNFAEEYLQLDYIFWGIEEPYYSREVLPYLQRIQR